MGSELESSARGGNRRAASGPIATADSSGVPTDERLAGAAPVLAGGPSMLSGASEEERLKAATAAIEALRSARLKPPLDAPADQLADAPVAPTVAPSAAPPAGPPADAPVNAPPELSPDHRTAAPRLRQGSRMLLIAIAAAGGGYLIGRLLLPFPEPAVPAAQPVAMVSAPDGGGETDALAEANRALETEVERLERETEELNAELLRLELRDAARISPFAADRTGGEAAATALDKTDKAFDTARRALELIELGSADPGADAADIERARRQVRERLLATVGAQAYAVGRHARGEPNRLVIATSDASTGLEAGDILVSVDGHRLFDLDDLRWVSAESDSRAADEVQRLLEIRRDRKPLLVRYTGPLDALDAAARSVDPAIDD